MKLPRKIKKRYKKIRGGSVGGFCYGVSLSDSRKAVTKTCPFYSKDGLSCKLLNINTKQGASEGNKWESLYACLSNQTAICAMESKEIKEFLNHNKLMNKN